MKKRLFAYSVIAAFTAAFLLSACNSQRSDGSSWTVHEITPNLIRRTIRAQRDYLLRQIHPAHHALFKLYDARADRAETQLRTIYTASTLWTLLKMNDFEKDGRIEAETGPMADFLLSMQEPDGEWKGAFYYSFDPATREKQPRLVVGTASKTIFTLLELHRRTGDPRYLAAAREAGLWLVGQVEPDGRVFPVVRRNSEGHWVTSKKQSVLYSCQTLSALSRLFAVTREAAFGDAADRIAGRMFQLARESGFFIGDDFRRPNTVSTSWLAMGFLDYSKIRPDAEYREAIYHAADELLKRQVREPENLRDDGRYSDTWASSGNGWIAEVLVEVHKQCVADGRGDCDKYVEALKRGARWLIQNVYSEQNSSHLPNPARALGGSIRNSIEESVRTDAVCHGSNSLIGILEVC